MQTKKNIKLGIINLIIFLILFINISFLKLKKLIKKNILVEINVLDKVSSKNTILKLKIGEEKKFQNLLLKF